MNKECMGIINLNKKGDNLRELSDSRVVASIPLGGRYIQTLWRCLLNT